MGHNLRNTCDLSDILSVIRSVYIDFIQSNELVSMLPPQESGHFLRGPITRIHVLNKRNKVLLGELLADEYKSLLNTSLTNSDIGIVHNDIELDLESVDILSREGYNTDSITLCWRDATYSAEWPSVIVLYEVWGDEDDLTTLYLCISRARVR